MPRPVAGAPNGSPACLPRHHPSQRPPAIASHLPNSLSQLSTHSHLSDRGATTSRETAPI